MRYGSLLSSRTSELEIDVFSNKSALILFWLLTRTKHEEYFSINELARATGNSIGLVHKVIQQLVYIGIVSTEGFRTKKVFHLKSPARLMLAWVQEYNLGKKTQMRGFSFFRDNLNFTDMGLVPALHTACDNYFHSKSTNLRGREYYLLGWDNLLRVSEKLNLRELDRGYEVLLIKPYYPALLEKINSLDSSVWTRAYALLTVLDLLHFPLRGAEQAETLFKKYEFNKTICSWKDIENALK